MAGIEGRTRRRRRPGSPERAAGKSLKSYRRTGAPWQAGNSAPLDLSVNTCRSTSGSRPLRRHSPYTPCEKVGHSRCTQVSAVRLAENWRAAVDLKRREGARKRQVLLLREELQTKQKRSETEAGRLSAELSKLQSLSARTHALHSHAGITNSLMLGAMPIGRDA